MAESRAWYRVEILKILDGNHFSARVLSSDSQDDVARDFRLLQTQIGKYVEDEWSTTNSVTRPIAGQVYLGKSVKLKGMWCRVKVNTCLHTSHGIEAKCILLDYGVDNDLIPVVNLREIPEQFLSVPFQAKRFKLHGIKPLSMHLSVMDDIYLVMGPSASWDKAVVTFIEKLRKEASHADVEVIRKDPNGELQVRLYITKKKGAYVCVNDLLVKQNYATYAEKDEVPSESSGIVSAGSDTECSIGSINTQAKQGPSSCLRSCLPSKTTVSDNVLRVSMHMACSGRAHSLSSKIAREEGISRTNSLASDKKVYGILDSNNADMVADFTNFSLGATRQMHDDNFSQVMQDKDEVVKVKEQLASVGSNKPLGVGRSLEGCVAKLSVGHGQSLGRTKPGLGFHTPTRSLLRPRASPTEEFGQVGHKSPSCQFPGSAAALHSGSDAHTTVKQLEGMSLTELSPGRSSLTSSETYPKHDNTVKEERSTPNQPSATILADPYQMLKSCYNSETSVTKQRKSLELFKKAGSAQDGHKMNCDSPLPEDYQVKVFRVRKPKLIKEVDDAPFSKIVKKVLHICGISVGTRLQCYAWPVLLRGQNVLGIGLKERGGKTLAYVAALLTMLKQSTSYSQLPLACGPYALILTVNAQKAADVSQYLMRFWEEEKDWRFLTLSAECDEDNLEIALLNGCELLVATPSWFLRMLSKRMTNLSRISHLVFDDLDLLLEHCPDQVNEVMRLFQEEVSQRHDQVLAPSQVIAMSSLYNRQVHHFQKTHMEEPVVVIASQIEAAFAGGVKQTAVVCHKEQIYEQLVSQITVSLASSSHKIIVFVSTESEVEKLYKILNSACIVCIRLHHRLQQEVLEEAIRQWTMPHSDDSLPVLVCTDDILETYGYEVNNATCVIHFDVPVKKSDLSRRLWSMRNSWKRSLEDEQLETNQKKQCLSCFYMTEATAMFARDVIELLDRCGSDVPQNLRQLASRHEEKNEKGKHTLLCDKLKAFGRCGSHHRCRMRHRVIYSLDQPGFNTSYVTVPLQGQVKILVTHVVHASHYFARLLEVTNSGNTTVLSEQYADLLMDMSLWYNVFDKRKQLEIIEADKLYAFEDVQHTFNRVLALETVTTERGKVKVYFVDTGAESMVDISSVFELPEQFKEIPYQAVEVYICRVRPKDGESAWAKRINSNMTTYIENKELVGNIVLSLGYTLWLDPLVSRRKLKHLGLTVVQYSARGLLLDSDQAEENIEHLQLLYELCKGNLDLPQLKQSPTTAFTTHKMQINTRSQELPVDSEVGVEVLVQAVDTPDLFYVQLKDDQESIQQLEQDIRTYLKLNQLQCPTVIQCSMLVLAKYPTTATWYRGRVSEVKSDDEYDIFFIDFGDSETVRRSDIRPMPSCFQTIPFYAIECCLIGVEPPGADWTEEDGDFFYELTRSHTDIEKPKVLTARVVSHTPARFTGRYLHGLELLDMNMSYCVNVAHQLVLYNKARLSSSRIQKLFPQLSSLPPESETVSVIRNCIEIATAQDAAQKVKAAEAIQKIALQSGLRREELVAEGLVEALSVVLQLTHQPKVLELIITSLVHLVKDSERLCEQLWNEGGLNSLAYVLNTVSDVAVLEVILLAFQQLLSVKSCVYMLNTLKTYHILSVILTQGGMAKKEALLVDVLSVLLEHVTGGELNDVDKCGCLKAVIDKFQNSDDPDTVCICLNMLNKLASSHVRAKDKIRKNDGVRAIFDQLSKQIDARVTEVALRTLKTLGQDNADNRKLIRNYLKNTDLDLCDIQLDDEELPDLEPIEPIPANHKLQNEPLPPEFCSDTVVFKSVKPEVTWTQDKWNVLLTVRVSRVRTEDVAVFTEDSVDFRVVTECTEYAFEFKLYELIVPGSCKVQIRFGSVLLGMRKKTRGFWPRLLKQKQQLPYLSVDFARIDISSSDESDQTEEPHEGPLSLAKRYLGEYVPFSLSNSGQVPRAPLLVQLDEASEESSSELSEDQTLINL